MSEQRTGIQNNSLHGSLREYADKLNDSGYSYFIFLEEARKKGFQVDWTEDSLKRLFRDVAIAMYSVRSTKDLDTKQIKTAYDVFERRLSEMSGVGCRWHSREEQMLKDNGWW